MINARPLILPIPATLMAPTVDAERPTYPIIDNNGETIGHVTVQAASGGVLLGITVESLPPGPHGMHFHAMGDCSPPATFANAGPHINPYKRPHGYLHPHGPHEGNLPNVIVHADGSADVELYSHMVRLDDGFLTLRDADGSSLIIHADRDDHVSQPIGGSGERIGCAVIKR